MVAGSLVGRLHLPLAGLVGAPASRDDAPIRPWGPDRGVPSMGRPQGVGPQMPALWL